MERKDVRFRSSIAGVVGLAFFSLLMSCVLPGIGSPSTPNSNTNPPAAPTGVKVTGSTITTISASWNAVAGATSYTVYYTVDGTTPSSSNNSGYNTSTTNSITFTPIST